MAGQSCEEGTLPSPSPSLCMYTYMCMCMHMRELGHAGGVHISEFIAYSIPSLCYFQRFKNAQTS